MSLDLQNAPYTFQRAMNYALTGIDTFAYLDDIIIFAPTLQEHSKKLREVVDRLRTHNLKLQPAKCGFLRKEILYLDHIITKDGVKPNPEKVKAIKNFPPSKNIKELESFLGLCGYYRKFTKNFAEIAKPLTLLLKKDNEFTWTSEQDISFQNLKIFSLMTFYFNILIIQKNSY